LRNYILCVKRMRSFYSFTLLPPSPRFRIWTILKRAEGTLYTVMTEEGSANEQNLPSFSGLLSLAPSRPFLPPVFPPLHLDKCVTTDTRCTFMKLSAFHRPRYAGMEKNCHLPRSLPRHSTSCDITHLLFSFTRAKLTSRKLMTYKDSILQSRNAIRRLFVIVDVFDLTLLTKRNLIA